MPLPARSAAVRGDDYQHTVGWLWAVSALDDDQIVSVTVEDATSGIFDDVVVRRRDTGPKYFQVKSSNAAGTVIDEAWLTTAAAPRGRSPLQHFYNTWQHLTAPGATFTLLTNRGVDHRNALLALRDNHTGLIPTEMVGPSGARSKIGKARSRWARHLEISETELLKFLDEFRIVSEGNEESLRDHIRAKMINGGLRGDEDAITRGVSIVRGWVKTGVGSRDVDAIRADVAAAGLFARQGTDVLALRTQTPQLQRPSDRATVVRSQGACSTTVAEWRTRASQAGCAVWSMEEFTASEATVHTAIGRREPRTGLHDPLDLPPYIPRDFDEAVRAEIAQAAAGQLSAMILLRGTSSTGKTRSLFEAARRLPRNSMIVRPLGAAAMRTLPAAALCDRPVVVWLNELQGFLGPDGTGLSRQVLRELFTTATVPPVLLATLWPDKQRDETSFGNDTASETAQLFVPNPWVRIHDVPRRFTSAELRTARHEQHDPRIGAALADPNKLGFTQTLAGGPELLAHYRAAPAVAQLLLDAAGDARRLGHHHALPGALLKDMALALWRDERGSVTPPEAWFDRALDYATRRLRSEDGIRALIPLDDPDTNQPIGYHLADYLEQHLIGVRATRTIPEGSWAALRAHTGDPNDLMELFGAAQARARFAHCEAFLRACGPPGLIRLGSWLASPPGRANAAESVETYRQAVAMQVPGGARHLALALGRLTGQEDETEAFYKQAVAERDLQAIDWYASWLKTRSGREDEIEALYRQAADLGDPNGRIRLAGWLSKRPDGIDEAERLYRDAAATGQTTAVHRLADWLTETGREIEAETLYMEVAATGSSAFVVWVAGWLSRRGKHTEAERLWQQVALTRDSSSLHAYAQWLMRRPGREGEAEQRYREAASEGELMSIVAITDWLSKNDRRAEAEALWRQALVEGSSDTITFYGDWLYKGGDEVEAEAQWRKAAEFGDSHAIRQLAYLLAKSERPLDEVETLWRRAVSLGSGRTLSELQEWLRSQGRHDEAETVWEHGLDANGDTAWPDPSLGRPGTSSD